MVIENIIENDSRLLKEESKKLIGILRERGVDEDIIFDIHVGFEEALRNAMIHGNKQDPAKKIRVRTVLDDKNVEICVEDEGAGFDPESLPDPTLGENILKESGRGVYLIKHLMDDVRYEDKGRRVIMIKDLNRKHV